MGVRGGACACEERGGVVFSLSLDSLTGDFSLLLPNMVARLEDDLGRFGFSTASSCSSDRLESNESLARGLSSFLASERSDTALSVFLFRLFLGLDCGLRGDGGLAAVLSVCVAARSWLWGWSGGSSGAWKPDAAIYGGFEIGSLLKGPPSVGVRLWPLDDVIIDLRTADLLRRCPWTGGAMPGVAIARRRKNSGWGSVN